MGVTRRDFLKISGGAVAAGSVAYGLNPRRAAAEDSRLKSAKATQTLCPFCSVGCGILVHEKGGKIVNIEGDPGHPINEGALCSKGASLSQLVNNPARLSKPRYRAPGEKQWKEVEWDWALSEIAKRIKATRDRTFKTVSKSKIKEKGPDGKEIEVEKEFIVNRTEGIAHVGSAQIDNEECYMLQKLLRSWGIVHIEHQAR
ncbi:MAG TPA: twin-arginine translocation signal domain-containing protein, partial [Dissulfurispiraceae bacterium]